jgi:predicted RNA-binding Zn-ribbon protein involved in translation (DUF1610 family)
MGTVCHACGYERKPTDQAPDWECPACGKAYVKTSHEAEEPSSGYPPGAGAGAVADAQAAPAYPTSGIRPITGMIIAVPAIFAVVAALAAVGASAHGLRLAAIALLMPWAAIMWAYVCRDSLLRELDAYASFMLCVGLFLLTPTVGLLALANSSAFHAWLVWRKGIPFAILFGLAFVVVMNRLSKDVLQTRTWLLWTLLMLVAFFNGGALVAVGNRGLDGSSATVYQATVAGKYTACGRGSCNYIATLAPSDSLAGGADISVGSNQYSAIVPGRSVLCVAAHPGFFGAAWGQQVSCAVQASAEN